MATRKPHAQVADTRSRRIDEVDGVPTTHTQTGWTHAWTVTDSPDGAAPLPFAAKPPIPAAVAVPAMCLLVMTATALSLMVVLDGRPDRGRIMLACFVGLGLWSVVLMVPALVRGLR